MSNLSNVDSDTRSLASRLRTSAANLSDTSFNNGTNYVSSRLAFDDEYALRLADAATTYSRAINGGTSTSAHQVRDFARSLLGPSSASIRTNTTETGQGTRSSVRTKDTNNDGLGLNREHCEMLNLGAADQVVSELVRDGRFDTIDTLHARLNSVIPDDSTRSRSCTLPSYRSFEDVQPPSYFSISHQSPSTRTTPARPTRPTIITTTIITTPSSTSTTPQSEFGPTTPGAFPSSTESNTSDTNASKSGASVSTDSAIGDMEWTPSHSPRESVFDWARQNASRRSWGSNRSMSGSDRSSESSRLNETRSSLFAKSPFELDTASRAIQIPQAQSIRQTTLSSSFSLYSSNPPFIIPPRTTSFSVPTTTSVPSQSNTSPTLPSPTHSEIFKLDSRPISRQSRQSHKTTSWTSNSPYTTAHSHQLSEPASTPSHAQLGVISQFTPTNPSDRPHRYRHLHTRPLSRNRHSHSSSTTSSRRCSPCIDQIDRFTKSINTKSNSTPSHSLLRNYAELTRSPTRTRSSLQLARTSDAASRLRVRTLANLYRLATSSQLASEGGLNGGRSFEAMSEFAERGSIPAFYRVAERLERMKSDMRGLDVSEIDELISRLRDVRHEIADWRDDGRYTGSLVSSIGG